MFPFDDVIMFFSALGHGGSSIVTLLVLDPPLCWDPVTLGLYNGVTFALKAIACVIFMKALKGRLSPSYLLLLGTISLALNYVCIGLATSVILPFIGCVVGSAAMLVAPVSRSMSSTVVKEGQQGSLFAGLGFSEKLSIVLSTPVVNAIFGEVPLMNHHLIFYGLAAFCIIQVLLILILLFVNKDKGKQEINITEDRTADTEDLIAS